MSRSPLCHCASKDVIVSSMDRHKGLLEQAKPAKRQAQSKRQRRPNNVCEREGGERARKLGCGKCRFCARGCAACRAPVQEQSAAQSLSSGLDLFVRPKSQSLYERQYLNILKDSSATICEVRSTCLQATELVGKLESIWQLKMETPLQNCWWRRRRLGSSWAALSADMPPMAAPSAGPKLHRHACSGWMTRISPDTIPWNCMHTEWYCNQNNY
jgi:hypothetical protein